LSQFNTHFALSSEYIIQPSMRSRWKID